MEIKYKYYDKIRQFIFTVSFIYLSILFLNYPVLATTEVKIIDGKLSLNGGTDEISAAKNMNDNSAGKFKVFFKLINADITPIVDAVGEERNLDESLINAINSNNIAEIKKIVEKIKKEDQFEKKINEAFFYVSAKAETGAVEILLNGGADVNFKNNFGLSALMHAAGNNKIDTVKLLIKRGAAVNAVNDYGMTALMCAAGKNSTGCIDELINAGANIEIQAPLNGINAFMIAVGANNIDAARLLIARGANMDVRAKNNRTALMLTTQYGYKTLYKILKDAGAIEYPYIEPDYK